MTLKDFQGLWEAPSLAAPPNAAAVMSGCYPSAAGLLPVGQAITYPAPPINGPVLGAFAHGPLQRSSGQPVTADLWIAGQHPTTASTMRFTRFRQDTSAWEVFYDYAAGTGIIKSPVWWATWRKVTSGSSSVPPSMSDVLLAAAFNDPGGIGRILSLPNPSSPTTNTGFLVYTAPESIGGMVSHQARLVWIESLYEANGGVSTYITDYPLIRFSDVDSDNIAGVNYFLITAASNGLPGFLAATDIGNLLVARSRDVHLIQGDLLNPGGPFDYILSFFTGAAMQIPAVTSEGIFFGRSDGPVVFWSGGAGTQDVSFGLKPGFWSSQSLLPFTGQFAWSEPFVLCPNGYMFDTRTRAWFKHPVLSNVSFWTVPYIGSPFYIGPNAARQFAWAAESNSSGSSSVYQVNLSEDPASARVNSWVWQSVPFTIEKNSWVEIREVTVLFQAWSGVAADQCTVTITMTNPWLSGAAGVDPFTQSRQSVIRGAPQLIRFPVAVKTEALQLQITVTASTGTANAGIVKEIRLGYHVATGPPRIGDGN